MFDSKFSRVLIVNFVTASIITFVACYFLKTFNMTDVMHIANIFGLYFLVIFGVDILIESGDLKNNRDRFLLVIALIVVFDLIFLIFTPLIFGNVFSINDYLTFIVNGARFDLILNTPIYLIIFAAIMLIFNYLLYRKDKKLYGSE
ncbi:hypothetical protein [Methanobrevibacter sp.]|uniref:hypothetical protein n=1 Tax=Methanobrevibacter sp. TaxID=66852 RepID=UPI003866A676